jgi:hypothetical protein
VLPERLIDLRLWLAGAVDLGEMFWLAVHFPVCHARPVSRAPPLSLLDRGFSAIRTPLLEGRSFGGFWIEYQRFD